MRLQVLYHRMHNSIFSKIDFIPRTNLLQRRQATISRRVLQCKHDSCLGVNISFKIVNALQSGMNFQCPRRSSRWLDITREVSYTTLKVRQFRMPPTRVPRSESQCGLCERQPECALDTEVDDGTRDHLFDGQGVVGIAIRAGTADYRRRR